LFAAVGIVLCILIPAASAQTTTVSIEEVTAAPEENATVPIMVNNVTNLSGCDINITFDPSVAHLTDVTPGNMTLLRYLINNRIRQPHGGWWRRRHKPAQYHGRSTAGCEL
jgi:hypothetical protein